jgi:hypothetical protein
MPNGSVRATSRKASCPIAKGTRVRGGGFQISAYFDEATLARIARVVNRSGLSMSTVIREMTKTGLRLAESGNPWRAQ